jgi:hypothetical protein
MAQVTQGCAQVAFRGADPPGMQLRHRLVALGVGGAQQVAITELNQRGGLRLAPQTVTWQATNQLTQAVTSVNLPRVTVGGVWLGQNREVGVPTRGNDESVASAQRAVESSRHAADRLNSNATTLTGLVGRFRR